MQILATLRLDAAGNEPLEVPQIQELEWGGAVINGCGGGMSRSSAAQGFTCATRATRSGLPSTCKVAGLSGADTGMQKERAA